MRARRLTATAQALANQGRDVTEIHQRRYLDTLVRRGEPEVVYSVVGNSERMKVDLADAKVPARFYLLDAILKCFGASTRLLIVYVRALAYVGITGLRGNVDRAVDGT